MDTPFSNLDVEQPLPADSTADASLRSTRRLGVLLAGVVAVVTVATLGVLLFAGVNSPSPSFDFGSDLSLSAQDYWDLPELPGLQNSVAYGFDTVSETFRYPVVALHYDAQQVYDDHRGNKYRVPDEISLRATPSTQRKDESHLFHHVHEYLRQKQSWMSVGVEAQVKFLNLSAQWQRTKHEMHHYFLDEARHVAFGERILAFYQLSMWPRLPAHPQIQARIKALPATGVDAEYKAFIHDFGTHYMSHAEFGGLVNWTSSYDKKLEERHDQSWVQQQLTISINIAKWKVGIDGKIGKNESVSDFDRDFAANSLQEVHSIGGAAELDPDKNTYQEWLPTVASNPVHLPHRSGLTPISELIRDPHIKQLMEQAIVLYGNGQL